MAEGRGETDMLMIDMTHLKTRSTASGLEPKKKRAEA